MTFYSSVLTASRYVCFHEVKSSRKPVDKLSKIRYQIVFAFGGLVAKTFRSRFLQSVFASLVLNMIST